MEKKSLEQLARLRVNEVMCEPKVAPILYEIRRYDTNFFLHSVNVAFVATQMAMQQGYFGSRLLDVARGGVLHDCGKLCIPIEILTKPDVLSPSEYEIVKEHPMRGVEILAGKGFSDTVLDIVLHHHERMDGSGYPDGLIGDQISEECAFVMAVDVWDAMTSERPYKRGMNGVTVFDQLKNSECYPKLTLRLLDLCMDR